MKEEKFLSARFGKENHFLVPDGYFGDFARKMESSLPERSFAETSRRPRSVSLFRKLRPWVAAACFCGIAFGGAMIALDGNGGKELQAADNLAQYYSQDNTLDLMADYTMLGNEDIYMYLAEE